MASSKWKSWEELNIKLKDRRVIFWGASNWVERTLNVFPVPPGYIVDNNPNNHGITYSGMTVYPPIKLREEDRTNVYIIVCTQNYPSVIDELSELDFVMGDDYCITPLLNERKAKDELKSVDTTVLVSSPQHLFESDHGGGLYECHTLSGKVSKVYSGKVRGMAYVDDALLIVDMLKGLVFLDRHYKVIDALELASNCEAHGLFYDAKSGRLFVGQPGRDSIAIYSLKEKKLINEIFISGKWAKNKKDNHHVNDLLVHDNSLYVSVFSLSGNWMNDVYDGGILEVDLETGQPVGPVASGLWMPHSISRFNGRLCYVDSMRGELYDTTWGRTGHFYSFIRGLDFDGRYYYVGASEHRYPEKLNTDNISLDAGFYLFDPATKMSRFFPIPQTEAVHSIAVKSQDNGS